MKNRLLLPLLPIILWGTSMFLNFLYTYITGDAENIMSAIISALITAAASFFVWLGSERKGTKAVKKLEENARLSKTVREQAEEIGALKAKNLSLEKQLSGYKKQRSRSDTVRGDR